MGCLISPHLDAPIIDDLDLLDTQLRLTLEQLAQKPRRKLRLDPTVMETIILDICRERYVTRNVLAKLLQRNPETLRKSYIDRLVKSRKIHLAFPGTPTHEKQSYRSA
jgi:hypothetical protein